MFVSLLGTDLNFALVYIHPANGKTKNKAVVAKRSSGFVIVFFLQELYT